MESRASCWTRRGRQEGGEAEGSLLTVGATSGVETGEAQEQLLPGLARSGGGERWLRAAEKALGSSEELCAGAVGLKAVVSYADETMREHVLEEAPNEVRDGHGELSGNVATPPIAVAEGDPPVLESHEALVADGDAMGIAAEVAEHLFRAGEGSFAVDDPGLGGGLSQEAASQGFPHRRSAGDDSLLDALEELAPEDAREDAYGDEEAGATGNPAVSGRVEAAAGHDAVQVRVEEQRLGPGVEHGDGSGGRSQAALTHGVQRVNGGFE